jgi:hypothetical protein
MEVLAEDDFGKPPQAQALLDEANQVTAIFAASSITARRRVHVGARPI